MTMLYRDQGVVLRTHKLGEADRIVSILTRGRGKVRAVAKGVRKTKSKFGARLEPTSHVALQLYEGRQLDIVTQAETIDHFPAIREDLDRLARASALLEAVDQVAREGERAPELYKMLVGALRTLANRTDAMIVPGFFLKLLAVEGVAPMVDCCASCGTTDNLSWFAFVEGGALCQKCRRGTPLSPEALRLVRMVLGGQLGAALNEPASTATREVDDLAARALEAHLERRIRSLTLIERP